MPVTSATANRMHNDSVAAAFEHTARLWPERPFLNVLPETADIYRLDAGAINYGSVLQQVLTLSDAFTAAGYTQGHRVLLLLENRPQFFIHWLALNRIGVSVIPVNPDLRLRELEYLIEHAQPALAITIPTHKTLLDSAASSVARDLAVVLCDQTIPDNNRTLKVVKATEKTAYSEAALLYTSGTTGNPKGCVLSNNYFLLAGQWYATTGGLCALNNDGEHMITPLPVFHMNAMAYSFMAMLTVGGCLTCLDRFHPRTWWHSVRQSGASCLHYLGVMPSLLMGMVASSNDRDHSVRFGFGAGIDPSLHKRFEHRFGFPLIEAWAMTETGAGVVIAANREPRQVGKSCFGRPSADIDIQLMDEHGHSVAANTPGELWVRHAGEDPRFGLFTEYYKDPEATAKAWEHGWFHTGDMVRQDDDGNMVFVDRKKNVIRRSGENIAAVEVESVLMRHPAITAVGVTAVPDAIRGDEVFACICVQQSTASLQSGNVQSSSIVESSSRAQVPNNVQSSSHVQVPGNVQSSSRAQVPGNVQSSNHVQVPGNVLSSCSEPLTGSREQLAREIVSWCLEQISYYKAPGYIAFVDALPLTSTQKIQRGELKAIAQKLINDPDTFCTTDMKKRQTASSPSND